jgi:ribosome modulation factor
LTENVTRTVVYRNGYNAGLLGKSEAYNPHQKGTDESKRWFSGYKRGKELVWFISITKVKKEG